MFGPLLMSCCEWNSLWWSGFGEAVSVLADPCVSERGPRQLAVVVVVDKLERVFGDRLAGPKVRDVQVVFCDAIAVRVDSFDLDVVRFPFIALVPYGDRKLAATYVCEVWISGEVAERDVEFVLKDLFGVSTRRLADQLVDVAGGLTDEDQRSHEHHERDDDEHHGTDHDGNHHAVVLLGLLPRIS